jgi:REP element-mobilizing transposase RayT
MATPPRQILPGSTYLVTRRCSERRFFLLPSGATHALVLFILAVVAERHGIRLHAFCVMSNHIHLVLTDVRGVLPAFQRDLDSLIARAVNAAIGHRESFWDRESYSVVPLRTAADILAKIVYVLANPVAAGLVRRGREWPGLWSDPRKMSGAPTRIDRPDGFFREGGPLPASIELRLHPPPGVEDAPRFREVLARTLESEEDRAASRLGHEGRSFVGAARARAQKWWTRPAREEPLGRLHPRVAGYSKQVRDEALAELRAFWDAYREALEAWRRGAHEVLFPPGTWAMRVHHGARCAAAP